MQVGSADQLKLLLQMQAQQMNANLEASLGQIT
jgi:hypothetical protein